ncbi:hypothetical protein NHQ30_003994 [Ciborinia camelliae]|nr:hypothetical protein NHQ30_003994 [Ciborinia camelliae]
MLRGVLVSAIYRKTTAIGISALDNSAAVTLMSTDVERITTGFVVVHELWAGLIQVGITTWLLKTQLGVACVAPILVSLFCTLLSSFVGSIAEKRQQSWMTVLQKRVGITAEMLSAMRGIKLAGLTEKLRNVIQRLRLDEIDSAGKYRQCLVWLIALAFIIFSAESSRPLSTNVSFTAISLITLLTNPLALIFLNFLPFASAIGCFDRVATFLATESRADSRSFTFQDDAQCVNSSQQSEKPNDNCDRKSLNEKPTNIANYEPASATVSIKGGVFGWIPENPVLRDIDCVIEHSKLTLVIGPIASGKSTFLKAILGEVPIAEGSLTLNLRNSSAVAFCDQVPWILNTSIRQNIIGSSTDDDFWYKRVIQACCLEDDFQNLLEKDHSIVGSKGFSLSGGQKQRLTIARAVYSRAQLILFDDIFSSQDAKTAQLISEQLWGTKGLLRLTSTTVVLASNSSCVLPFADTIMVIGKDGAIEKQDNSHIAELSEVFSRQEYSRIDTSQENIIVRDEAIEAIAAETTLAKESSPGDSGSARQDSSGRQTGELAVYRFYFATIGSWSLVLFFISMLIFSQIDLYLGLYGGFQIMALLAVTLSAWELAYIVMVKSGARLHFITLSTVTSAPFSFFSETDTGQITNMFSQDFELIDGELPTSLLGAGSFYLRTSRQIRLLDLEAKSPLYSHFLETLSGLAHIRAFKWAEKSCVTNHELLDNSQRPFYLLFMIQRWLTLVLDLFCGGIAFLVVTLAVILRDRGSASPGLGFTGVALVNIITFATNMTDLLEMWTKLETSIGAVSRIKSFSEDIQAEDEFDEVNYPSVDWPKTGKLEFISGQECTQQYQFLDPTRGKNWNMRAQRKVGAMVKHFLPFCANEVSPYNSGKSSLILALFRMLDLNSGAIFVDSQDISKIPRSHVRSKLNALPQEPFFFSRSSVRMNLDPFETSNDISILDALEKVELRARILDHMGGLDGEMNPDLLSHGQKQLFSLASIMLRNSNIVVLDEATSRSVSFYPASFRPVLNHVTSVDPETDDKIQRVIRDVFADKTIIAVAHRLDTILDFDKIAVMDKGMLVEFDKPEILLEKQSLFRELYHAYKSGGESE